MPDITMCKGGECPRKQECYRFTATPTPHYQSFFMTPPFKPDGTCEHFAEIYNRSPRALGGSAERQK